MTDTPNAPKTIDDIVADKQAKARNGTLETLATFRINAENAKQTTNINLGKIVEAYDAIIAKTNEVATGLDKLTPVDTQLAINDITQKMDAARYLPK